MIKNVKIRFNLNNEKDRKAYDYLQGVEIVQQGGHFCYLRVFRTIRKDGNRRCFP